MPIATTTTSSSNYHPHHHQQQASAAAVVGRSVRLECVWEKTRIFFFCICSTLSCYDKLGIKHHLIKVLFFGHQTNYI